jgi:predicted MFS family arabinose efflux permease
VTATSSGRQCQARSPLLVPSLIFIALVVAAVGSLGAPLITSVATTFHVSLASAQWTLTITLLSGAVATPLLGRLGAGPRRRGTIIGTLAIVTAGSVLTVLPLPFACLLAGRAAQGAGLGLTALMMGVARDHLDRERAAAVIALVSVASTIGIGVGYPLAGLLTEFGGVRAAYGLGAPRHPWRAAARGRPSRGARRGKPDRHMEQPARRRGDPDGARAGAARRLGSA